MAVKFAEQGIKSGLKNKQELKLFIDKHVLMTVNKTCDLQYIFVSDEALLAMNQQFLAHDTFTDIITFDLSEKPDKIIGEIYISIDRVKENAVKFGVDYLIELHRVVFHGALHLCGYKDKTSAHKKAMRGKEEEWLAHWEVWAVLLTKL
jgi:probable rRNA maturation factor